MRRFWSAITSPPRAPSARVLVSTSGITTTGVSATTGATTTGGTTTGGVTGGVTTGVGAVDLPWGGRAYPPPPPPPPPPPLDGFAAKVAEIVWSARTFVNV